MHQQNFTSHVLVAHYRKTLLLRDWDLNARLSMVYQKCQSEFHLNTKRGDCYALKTSLAMLRITRISSISPNTHAVISERSRPCYRTNPIVPNCPTVIPSTDRFWFSGSVQKDTPITRISRDIAISSLIYELFRLATFLAGIVLNARVGPGSSLGGTLAATHENNAKRT
jgi:hypothetical protein